ncbi:MAG: efflux RND transporter permease subunit [Prevotella sp.]|nr:efflux RND transporter permease subunit [Prevotella sp.]
METGRQGDKSNLVTSAMRHKSITLLLVLVMMLAGIASLIYIPKDEFPQVDLPVGLVVGVYPGASELEVEQQLAKPLEDFLWTFKEIDREKTTTMSMNDGCAAVVWLNGTESSKTEFWNKLKERLALFRITLPTGVLGLVANDDFGDASAMLLTIESDSKTFRELGGYADGLSDRLRRVKSLANVIRMGGQKEQLSIYLDRDRLSMYGINTAMLMSKVSGLTGTLYTGSLEDGKLSRRIHIQSSLNTEQDLAQTIVSTAPTGEVVRLSDIATIKREYPEPRQYIKNNGRQCLLLSLQMIRGKNIIDFGTEVKQLISDYQQTLPKDVHINVISDQSQVVDHSIQDFMFEMLIAIVSVIIVVCLMLPLRVAGVAVVTIPITIFASIAIFLVTGVEINSVTLAALLVSLGMIVDDSVVVVDCYLDKIDSGMDRWRAAVESSREFVKSIITATLVISITFFPFLFTTSKMIHDFIQWFPYAIGIVLTVSLVVAIFVVPILQHQFIKKGLHTGSDKRKERNEGGRKTMLERMQGHYDGLIEWCFRHRRATIAIGLASIVLGAVLILMLPIRLMPRAERNQFAVDIILPIGTDLNYTAQVADSLASIMRKDERVVNLTTFYGSGSPRFHATFMPNFGGTHFAQFIVNTHSDKETQEMLDDYAHRYSYYFPEAQILFRQIEYSDHQYPVEVVVKGDNLDSLHVAVDSIHHRLSKNKDIDVLTTSFGTTGNRLEVTMKPEEANRIGMSKSLLSLNFALRYGGGIPVATIWEGDHELSITVKDADKGKHDIDEFKNIRVTGLIPTITAAPLSQIADVKPGWGSGTIERVNGERTASVFGMMGRQGVKVGELTENIYRDLKTLRLPDGVKLEEGGQAETERTYRPQMYLGMQIAIVLIFFIIVFHLKSIPLTLLIMSSLGFSMIGGALGLHLFGQEFGATGVLGFVSLMGIITRCGIIMIDYAEELRQEHPTKEAALLSAKRRFRPVFLTSMAASMGVIPMVIKDTPLWGPMGVIICIGALVSMLFIITMIPVGYSIVRERF